MLHVKLGTVGATVAKLRRQPGVAYAAANPIARATTVAMPDDVGIRGYPGGLAALQWNFFGDRGRGRAGGLDERAGRRCGRAARASASRCSTPASPTATTAASSARPTSPARSSSRRYDFVDNRREAVDRNGHGTHVAGTIAETTNNRVGVAGLAYGATIMPVRVLDSQGYGDAATIAKGIRYAARHNAKVINMSLEFSTSVKASEIPDIMAAIRYANEEGSVVIGSTGNEGEAQVAFPRARASSSPSARRPTTAASQASPTTASGSTSSPRAAATTRCWATTPTADRATTAATSTR